MLFFNAYLFQFFFRKEVKCVPWAIELDTVSARFVVKTDKQRNIVPTEKHILKGN